MMDEIFIKALINHDTNTLKKIPKGDLHNHAIFSCTKLFLNQNGISVPRSDGIQSISGLLDYGLKFIYPLTKNINTIRILINGNFVNCINTGVKIVSTSIGYKYCEKLFDGNVSKYIEFLKSFQYKNLQIKWILDIGRDNYKDEHKQIIMELIKTKFFAGIDLSWTENSIPNEKFAVFFKKANELGLTTKVHAGEQLGADYILSCINVLNPKQIQHGIRIVEDKNVMELAKKKDIIFNVCPTSNVMLGYAQDYKNHPISIMVKYGLKVTIGTDDLLIFDSNINDEYLKLYEYGALSAEQLNKIRKLSISEQGD